MRTTTHLGRRLAALLATGALAAGLGLVMSPEAQAAPNRGTLSITPTTGNELTGLTATISTACPAGAGGLLAYVTGPGIGTETLIQGNRPANDTTFQISGVFKDVFQANAITSPSGIFTVRVACLAEDAFTETGEYTQTVTFTPRSESGNPVPNGGTFVVNANAKPATTTTLAVPTPGDPVIQGTSVTLNATVALTSDAGTPAAGSVQFKAGTTNLGAAQPLTAGAASLTTTAIPAGTQNLTAVYVPGANEFAPSTSAARSYVVAAPAVITGTPRVDSTIGCSGPSGGTRTFTWKRNGVVVPSITTSTFKVPASWANTTVVCAITTTKDATSVTRTSAGKKIAVGLAPKAVKRPSILGTPRVGKVLTCAKGTWTPTPTSYKYVWLRAGKLVAGKTTATYKTTRLDKGKLVTCRVTTVKAGYAAGVATAAAKKVT